MASSKKTAPSADVPPSCWLVKQEPDSYSWADFANDGETSWDGVRNYQARNNLKAMKKGDLVLFYSSGESREAVGIAKVAKTAYPDPTADEPGWVSVRLRAIRALKAPVTLAQVKATPSLSNIALVRNSRLSVMPLTPEAFEDIVSMAG